MEKYILYDGKIKLLFDNFKHVYTVNDEIIHGVSSITGVLDKPALKFWAVNMAIELLYDRLVPGVPLDEVEVKDLLEEARRAHTRRLSKAADIGTMIHEFLERYVKAVLEKKELPKRPINKEMQNAIDGFFDWIKDNKVEFIASEQKVYSRKNKFAGTFDLEAFVNGRRTIIDFKTSKAIYPEMLLQSSAYLKAKQEETGDKYDGGVIILRLSKEDKEKHIESFEVVQDTNIETHYKCFLACLSIFQWKTDIKRQEAEKKYMTKNAKSFLDEEIKKGNIELSIPRLQLAERLPGGGTKSTGPHTITMVRDEVGQNKDYMSQEMVDGIWFFLKEDEKEFKYFVPYKNKQGAPHYLMERLAPINEGEVIVMEYVSQGLKGYIDVRDPGQKTYPDPAEATAEVTPQTTPTAPTTPTQPEIPVINAETDNVNAEINQAAQGQDSGYDPSME